MTHGRRDIPLFGTPAQACEKATRIRKDVASSRICKAEIFAPSGVRNPPPSPLASVSPPLLLPAGTRPPPTISRAPLHQLCSQLLPQVAGWDLFRKLTSRVANFLAHTLLSPGVTDLTGSYRLFTKEALEDIMKEVTSKGARGVAASHDFDKSAVTAIIEFSCSALRLRNMQPRPVLAREIFRPRWDCTTGQSSPPRMRCVLTRKEQK